MRPPRNGTRRIKARTIVLLPLPFGPTTAVIAPGGVANEMPSSASLFARW